MVLDSEIFLLFSFTVILGYLGSLFYYKTRVPDIIWLLIFGIILGPVLHLYDPSPFVRTSPFMSIIALCIIIFDAGINMDLSAFLKSFPRSILLTFLYYVLTMILVGSVSYLFMKYSLSLLECLLIGAMLSTSTVTVSSILHAIETSLSVNLSEVRDVLILESILSDSIAFITVITVIRLTVTPYTSIIESFENVFLSFIFSIGFGFLSGVFWSFSLNRLSGQKFNYILTMAMVFLIYVISEELVEGSGALTLLFFALLIINSDTIFEKFGLKGYFIVDSKHLRELHEEISFLLKSFFFVYVGLITYISFEHIFLGIIISLLVFISRILCVKFYDLIFKISNLEKSVITYTFANGLPALVMSRLPLVYDPNKIFFKQPEIYTNICLIAVFITVLFGVFIAPYMASRSVKNNSKIGNFKLSS